MTKNRKTKVKIILVLNSVLIILLFSACGNDVSNISTEKDLGGGETGTLASNNAVDFYFYYPVNWTLHRNDSMITVQTTDSEVFESDALEGISGEPLVFTTAPNISAWAFILLEDYATVEEYWENFGAPSMQGIFQDISDAESEDLVITGENIPAKKYTYTLSSAGMGYKISQIIFFKNRQIYLITYTATENKYDAYAKVLGTVAETFEFK